MSTDSRDPRRNSGPRLPVWALLLLVGLGLLLSVHIKQLENFAGTMNFVIFPMYFMSTALYPLWKLQESGADVRLIGGADVAAELDAKRAIKQGTEVAVSI